MVKKRFWHNLKPNKSSSRPARHLFVDVESRLIKHDDGTTTHKLWVGWCCYWRRRSDGERDMERYMRFDTIGEFWGIVLDLVKSKMPLYLVSHNTSYDFGVLDIFQELEAEGYDMTSIYLGNLAVIMRFRNKSKRLIVLDNCNFFQGKLATLGEAIGYPKHDVDPLTDPLELVDPYCRRDVEILVKLWKAYYKFIDDHDLGNWGSTLPSQAFKAYRHRFMNHKITIHGDMDALELEREAYHGGRTSAFWKGEATGEQFYKVDVNSMYPYVMHKHEFPCLFVGMRGSKSVGKLKIWLKNHLIIAKVTVNTDEPVYPVMVKGHLVHPVGRFDTVLSTPELKYAIEHDHLERVHSHALYKPAPIFREYVEYFYKLKEHYRASGDNTSYLMVKLYLNSLYGKFGQKSETWERWLDAPPNCERLTLWDDPHDGGRWRVYHFGGRVWRAQSSGEASDSFPAIAAHVTAHARLYLWKLIKTAGRDHTFYCDTDSLIIDQQGYDNLAPFMSPSILGMCKIEAQSDSMAIVCPKHYMMAGDWKRKGIPSKAVDLGDNAFECTQFPSFKTQGRQEGKGAYKTKTVVKHLTGKIFDGVPSEGGWIHPLDAGDVVLDRFLTDDQQQRIADIDAECDALKESLRVDQQTVFTVWDYRTGTWKRARAKGSVLVALEYSDMDAKATELGFADLAALQRAVTDYLDIRIRIGQLHAERTEILYPAPSLDTPGEMPW